MRKYKYLDMWEYRGKTVRKDEQGIFIVGCLHLFKTLTDAEIYIDKHNDEQVWERKWNCREPKIVGKWEYKKGN